MSSRDADVYTVMEKSETFNTYRISILLLVELLLVVARVVHVELHIAPMIRIILCSPQAWVAKDKEMILPKLCGSTHSVLLQVSTIHRSDLRRFVRPRPSHSDMMPVVNEAFDSTRPS